MTHSFYLKLLLLFIIFTNIAIASELCKEIFSFYNIKENIKTYKGWMRVCNNDKIELYIDEPISIYDKEQICQCFTDDTKDRDIQTIRSE